MRKRNVKGLLFAAAFMIAGTQLTRALRPWPETGTISGKINGKTSGKRPLG